MTRAALQTVDDSFRTRLVQGQSFEDRVRHTLWLSGYKAYRFGSDLLAKTAKDRLVQLDDPTSSFARYLPDLIVTVDGRGSFLVECKFAEPDKENVAIELGSWTASGALMKLGIRVLVVCPGNENEGLRAEWFDRLRVVKSYPRPPRMNCNGSGKGFVTVARSGMRGLAGVMKEFKDEK